MSRRVPISAQQPLGRVLCKVLTCKRLLSHLGNKVDADCGECGASSSVLDEAWGVDKEGG